MRLSGQFEVNLFFLQKNLKAQKAPKRKTNHFRPVKSFVHKKNCCLCCFLFAYLCFDIFFVWFAFLSVLNFFVKKNLTSNCPDNLIYYLLACVQFKEKEHILVILADFEDGSSPLKQHTNLKLLECVNAKIDFKNGIACG